MGKLTEELGRILNLLEDAVEEQDWALVKKMIEDLDSIYEQLEKQESGFNYDYE
jgi:lipopolysaccharide biosynthesis regulator YciM